MHAVGDTVRVRRDLDLIKLLNKGVGYCDGMAEVRLCWLMLFVSLNKNNLYSGEWGGVGWEMKWSCFLKWSYCSGGENTKRQFVSCG